MIGRLEALRKLLVEGTLSTQEELREKLEKQKYAVNQSTISRDLRKLNAIRTNDQEGRVVYRLPSPGTSPGSVVSESMVTSITPASALVVIQTSPGSASLVARHLDLNRPAGLVGTIAGDDTVFLAFSAKQVSAETIETIRELVRSLD